jgi:hypothetical protein
MWKINTTGFVSIVAGYTSITAVFSDGRGANATSDTPIGITNEESSSFFLELGCWQQQLFLIWHTNPSDGTFLTTSGDLSLLNYKNGHSSSASFNPPYGIASDAS